MNIEINKNGKSHKFKLIEKWTDVTLEKWIKLIDFHSETKSVEALKTIAELSTIPMDLIKQLELKDVAAIMSKISELQEEQKDKLKRVIDIEGNRYGFHPNLDEITLGEWADIETFMQMDIEKKLPEIMAILYRPIVEEKNNIYTIEAYDGNISIRTEIMRKMSAEQVQSALVFFYHFVNVLFQTLPSYLIQRLKETKTQLQHKALQKNGDTLV